MIRLSYTQYSRYFSCKIENINELSVEVLQKLESFISARSGKLDYEKESFIIPKKIEMHHLQELFNITGIDVFLTEKAPNVRIADSAVINFGKFKGTKWINLEDDYLLWLSKNINGDDRYTALSELQRRKNSPASKDAKEFKQIIGFGKHRGKMWDELPKDYLLWISSNLQGKAKKYADIALSYKS